MALRRICLLATAASIAACCGQAIAAGTLRVDYFHTGGKGAEIFGVDRVVAEPLPWPKADFEARQRDFQAKRRPENEMTALFREEQAYTSGLLSAAAYAGPSAGK